MLVLEAGNIKKYYGDRLIIGFEDIKIYSGDRIGVVGQNGSGKTTLMNILAGELAPDEGFIRRYCDIAYIRQFSEESYEADQRMIKEFDLAQKIDRDALSGGEKARIKIANALSSTGLLLFADEPTANLDYKGIELLREKLSGVESFLLISHDRLLLDSLCSRIIEIKDGKLRVYEGNYSFYKGQSRMEHVHAGLEYEKYMSEKNSLEAAITDRQGRAKAVRKAPSRMGNSEARLHTRRANEKQEKIHNAVNSLKTRLEKLEVKEKPKELPKIRLDFSLTNPPENKIVIYAEKLGFSYGSVKIFDNAGFKVFNGCKTALLGGNGTGKSTLLNLVNRGSCESIRIVPKAKIGYFCQEFENLDYDRTVLDNVMKDSVQTQTAVRTILARLLIAGDDVYKKVGLLSGGERIKVSFAKLFVSSANILLLDEPTNYLDMMSIEALENVLCDYEGTVLFVSHDKAFVNAVAERLLVIEGYGITEFDGNLEEYEIGLGKKLNNECLNKNGKASAGRNGQGKPRAAALSEIDRMLLQMRITEVVSKLSKADKDRDALEAEYQQLVMRLK